MPQIYLPTKQNPSIFKSGDWVPYETYQPKNTIKIYPESQLDGKPQTEIVKLVPTTDGEYFEARIQTGYIVDQHGNPYKTKPREVPIMKIPTEHIKGLNKQKIVQFIEGLDRQKLIKLAEEGKFPTVYTTIEEFNRYHASTIGEIPDTKPLLRDENGNLKPAAKIALAGLAGLLALTGFASHLPTLNAHSAHPQTLNQNQDNPYLSHGDTNGDFMINDTDFNNFIPTFGAEKEDSFYNPNCDFNQDGKINGIDLIKLLIHFGEDHRFDDYDKDGAPNIVEKELGTNVVLLPQDEIQTDEQISYIVNEISKNLKPDDYYSLLVAAKVLERAVEKYPFNSPPVKDNNRLTRQAGKYVRTIVRFLTEYDLLKGQEVQTGLEKLKNYIERNLTDEEIKYFCKLIKEDVDSLKTMKDIEKITKIAKSMGVDLYLSQIKNPDDEQTVEKMKELFRKVYNESESLGKTILDKYIFQAILKDYYNDPTLAFAILKSADEKLASEIYNHPKTLLAYVFNTRPFIAMNEFSTKQWRRKLDIKNIQKELERKEFENLVGYAMKKLNSVFVREKKIDEIRRGYGNEFKLEDYILPQLLFTFNPRDLETNFFIQFFSNYVKDYHTLLKALFDTADEEDKMFELLEKFYNEPDFSFFKSDREAARNIVLIFEQNYGLHGRARYVLPYDLFGKLIQDYRPFSEQYEDGFRKVDFDMVWDTLTKILTPNNGYKYKGICQNNEALAKRVFNTLLLPFVSYYSNAFDENGNYVPGHAFSGIFLENGLVTGMYLNGRKYFFDYILVDTGWMTGFGDNFFGKITNKSGGSYVYPHILVFMDERSAISDDPSLKDMIEIVKGEPEFRENWKKFNGNYIPISMLSWMIDNGTKFMAFGT